MLAQNTHVYHDWLVFFDAEEINSRVSRLLLSPFVAMGSLEE